MSILRRGYINSDKMYNNSINQYKTGFSKNKLKQFEQ
ncbi:hypothetical protein Catovirus_1_6 [Catovirus CTV1]|uniref:Uncharacterized protein n=1 Tax=Catovirus CTV1 TaxID=1977631 RepID=A0A1V0S8D0_9VIRU|nr:hypothetical protein Catovirus_1_6 [Catovirus CTV1]